MASGMRKPPVGCVIGHGLWKVILPDWEKHSLLSMGRGYVRIQKETSKTEEGL